MENWQSLLGSIGLILFILNQLLGIFSAFASQRKHAAFSHAVLAAWSRLDDVNRKPWLAFLFKSQITRIFLSVVSAISFITYRELTTTAPLPLYQDLTFPIIVVACVAPPVYFMTLVMSKPRSLWTAVFAALLIFALIAIPIVAMLILNAEKPATLYETASVVLALFLYAWACSALPVLIAHLVRVILRILEFSVRKIAESHEGALKATKSVFDVLAKVLKGSA